ncbi:hypothetical protein TrVFT333_000782 [Trichoderma virens FT-333]|nr:hypothetical protein TrVFT333_000782 [Trichoderma virens FT-333]
MATWEAEAPLRGARERTRGERVRFGADTEEPGASGGRKRRRRELQTARKKKKKATKQQGAEKRRSRSGRNKQKQKQKQKRWGKKQRCVWTRKTRTAGMEVVQLVSGTPSRKSAIRDSLQALSSGLPSSLWAGGERPLAGPRAGTGTGTGCGRGTLRCTSAAVAGEVPQTFKSVPLVQCRGLVPFEWHSDSVD